VYRTTIQYHERVQRGEVPVPYILIQTAMGWRCYAEKEMKAFFDTEANLADGSVAADGSETAGGSSLGLLEKSARVKSFGSFKSTISPSRLDVLSSFTTKQQKSLTVTLINSDLYFSRLIPQEHFLGRRMILLLGFESLPYSAHLKQFWGEIDDVRLDDQTATVRAIES